MERQWHILFPVPQGTVFDVIWEMKESNRSCLTSRILCWANGQILVLFKEIENIMGVSFIFVYFS